MFNDILEFIQKSQLTQVIIIIIIAFIVSRILKMAVYNLVILFSSDKDKKRTNKLLKSYCNIIATVLKYLVYAIAIVLILGVYKFELVTVITSAGFIGILITYIFQDPIKDITNGFFIVFAAPFEIGDSVKINNFVGKVVEFESRYVVISDINGNKYIVNNRVIDNVVVLNKGINFNKKVR